MHVFSAALKAQLVEGVEVEQGGGLQIAEAPICVINPRGPAANGRIATRSAP
jgi:hypothetical protein